MRRNLNSDHCVNKQEAAIAAYVEELEENDKKIAEGAWATSLDLSRITFWYPILDDTLPEPPAQPKLEAGAGEHEEAEGPGGVLFLGLELIFYHNAENRVTGQKANCRASSRIPHLSALISLASSPQTFSSGGFKS